MSRQVTLPPRVFIPLLFIIMMAFVMIGFVVYAAFGWIGTLFFFLTTIEIRCNGHSYALVKDNTLRMICFFGILIPACLINLIHIIP